MTHDRYILDREILRNSSMWGSLRLASIVGYINFSTSIEGFISMSTSWLALTALLLSNCSWLLAGRQTCPPDYSGTNVGGIILFVHFNSYAYS